MSQSLPPLAITPLQGKVLLPKVYKQIHHSLKVLTFTPHPHPLFRLTFAYRRNIPSCSNKSPWILIYSAVGSPLKADLGLLTLCKIFDPDPRVTCIESNLSLRGWGTFFFGRGGFSETPRKNPNRCITPLYNWSIQIRFQRFLNFLKTLLYAP